MSLGSAPDAASAAGSVRPYSSREGSLGPIPQRNRRPSWTGWSVSMNNWARPSGSPAATQRSQNPDTMSVSEVPARPAWVSHAANALKEASFIPALYRPPRRSGRLGAGGVATHFLRPLCYRERLRAIFGGTEFSAQIKRTVDQADVAVGLRKVAQHAASRGIELFCEQADVIAARK